MMSVQDLHAGTQLLASAQLLGSLLVGTVTGGVVLSLARLPGSAYTTWLCIFSALGLLPFCVARARCALVTLGFLCSESKV